jgi:hypothetical protein
VRERNSVTERVEWPQIRLVTSFFLFLFFFLFSNLFGFIFCDELGCVVPAAGWFIFATGAGRRELCVSELILLCTVQVISCRLVFAADARAIFAQFHHFHF